MYIIKSVAMANYLLKNQSLLKSIDRDRNDRSKLIFLFEDTKTLRELMNNYIR